MRRNGTTIISAAVLFVLFALRTGLADEPLTRFEFHRKAMGVDFTVVLYGSKMGSANTAAKAALDRVTQLDGICSDYKANSELRQLCARARPGRSMSVSEDLARVLGVQRDATNTFCIRCAAPGSPALKTRKNFDYRIINVARKLKQ